MDADTERPIQGAAVLFSWVKVIPHVAGGSHHLIDSELAYTDAEGHYKVSARIRILGPLAFFSRTEITIYKPGYVAYLFGKSHDYADSRHVDYEKLYAKPDKSFPSTDDVIRLAKIPPDFDYEKHHDKLRDIAFRWDRVDDYKKQTSQILDLAKWEELRELRKRDFFNSKLDERPMDVLISELDAPDPWTRFYASHAIGDRSSLIRGDHTWRNDKVEYLRKKHTADDETVYFPKAAEKLLQGLHMQGAWPWPLLQEEYVDVLTRMSVHVSPIHRSSAYNVLMHDANLVAELLAVGDLPYLKTTIHEYLKKGFWTELLKLIDHPDEHIRSKAMALIGEPEIFTPSTLIETRRVLEDKRSSPYPATEAFVRRALQSINQPVSHRETKCLQPMGIISGSNPVPPYEDYIPDEVEIVKLTPREVREYCLFEKEEFLPMLKSRNPDVRINGMRLMSQTRLWDDSLCKPLKKMLNDENSRVRILAIITVGNRRCLSSVNPLLDLLARGDYPDAPDAARTINEAARAIMMFGKSGDLDAIPPLVNALSNKKIRPLVIGSLRDLGDRRAIPYLLPLLSDSDDSIGIDAADALDQLLNNKEIVDLFWDRFNEGDGRTVDRLRVPFDLLLSPHDVPGDNIAVYLRLLEKGTSKYSEYAKLRLKYYPYRSVVIEKVSARLYTHPDNGSTLLKLLSELKDTDTVPIFLNVIRQDAHFKASERTAAIDAVGKLSCSAAKSTLTSIAKNPQEQKEIRQSASRVLAECQN